MADYSRWKSDEEILAEQAIMDEINWARENGYTQYKIERRYTCPECFAVTSMPQRHQEWHRISRPALLA